MHALIEVSEAVVLRFRYQFRDLYLRQSFKGINERQNSRFIVQRDHSVVLYLEFVRIDHEESHDSLFMYHVIPVL